MSGKGPKPPREPRLRASCDACFLAKVKCSKDRPFCKRCLTNGGNCNYSPSSRTGKPKADGSKRPPTSSPASYNNILFTLSDSMAAHMPAYELDTEPLDTHESLPRSVLDDSVPRTLSFDGSLAGASGFESLDCGMDHFGQQGPSSLFAMSIADQSLSWHEPVTTHNNFGFATMPTMSDILSSSPVTGLFPFIEQPDAPEHYGMLSRGHQSTHMVPNASCHDCFTILLQSYQSLRDIQSSQQAISVTLDTMLSLSRKARESCAALLSCESCMRQAGTQTTAMLLSLVIKQILMIYQKAGLPGLDAGLGNDGTPPPDGRETSFSVSVGAYRLGEEGARQLWRETLNLELERLKKVYNDFQMVCARDTQSPELCRAVAEHLKQELGNTLARRRQNSRFGFP